MNHACLQKIILFCCRDFYLIPKGEELLDKHFPGESRIPLLIGAQVEKSRGSENFSG